MRKTSLILFCLMTLFACRSAQPLLTVQQLDVKKYSGTWYEIARFTHRFEKGLECVSATYTPLPNGKIEVLNQGYTMGEAAKLKTAKGVAWVPDFKYPGRLKVQFFWPFSGNYWVIDLDPNYRYVLVGDASRKYLWILSRTKTLDPTIYDRLVITARQAGFNVEKLDKIRQDCR